MRKYPDDPAKEVFEAANSGDADLLDEVLQQMNVNERASALETRTVHVSRRAVESTPLIAAAWNGNLDCVKVLLSYKADLEGRCNDKRHWDAEFSDKSYTATFVAATYGHVAVLSCLVENGADVNTRSTVNNFSPLMKASENGHMNVVTFLVGHGGNMDLQDKDGNTALHYAFRRKFLDVAHKLLTLGANVNLQDKDGKTPLHHAISRRVLRRDTVLTCLVKNGADINSCANDNCTPLMIASRHNRVNAVTFLVEHGANMDLQDEDGNTALHYAIYNNSFKVARKLLTLGASQLHNTDRLTPLLLASKRCMTSLVETFIETLEGTKEQRIDALELLGASLAFPFRYGSPWVQLFNPAYSVRAFQYMKRGMEERFQDPSHPLLKQPMKPVEAYQNRKESQTLEELAQIEGDVDAILMESLIISERILGAGNKALLRPIKYAAEYHSQRRNFDIGIGLYKRLMEISQRCDHKRSVYLGRLLVVVYKMIENSVPPRLEVLVEILKLTFLEYERDVKLGRGLDKKSLYWERDAKLGRRLDCRLLYFGYLFYLLNKSLELLQIIAKVLRCVDVKNSFGTVFLRKLSCSNFRDEHGHTLLHLAAVRQWRFATRRDPPDPLGFPCAETMKLLLNAGFNVNAIDKNGDTPLHLAVTFRPYNDELHILTDMLTVLLDGGAHHDFLNNRGKTAMDMAATDEARRILSERKTLELKCIAARAVKKFGLPYLGVVPKVLEKYISMH